MALTNSANAVALCPENSFSYPGWRVVVVCHLGVLVGFATVFIYSFSLMVKPLQEEFGWNRGQISQAFSLAAISVAICSPFMGKLFDRFEPRKIIAAFMAAFGLGLASLAWLTPHLSQFYLSAVLIGVAGSGTYQLGYARIVTNWFERRLGAALSIVVAGSGAGSFIVPPLVQHLIATYGWRHTYLLLSGLPLLIGAPLTLLFARSPRIHATRKTGNVVALESSGATWRQAIVSRKFLLLALGVCCVSLSENGALAHLVPMLSDRGSMPVMPLSSFRSSAHRVWQAAYCSVGCSTILRARTLQCFLCSRLASGFFFWHIRNRFDLLHRRLLLQDWERVASLI